MQSLELHLWDWILPSKHCSIPTEREVRRLLAMTPTMPIPMPPMSLHLGGSGLRLHLPGGYRRAGLWHLATSPYSSKQTLRWARAPAKQACKSTTTDRLVKERSHQSENHSLGRKQGTQMVLAGKKLLKRAQTPNEPVILDSSRPHRRPYLIRMENTI